MRCGRGFLQQRPARNCPKSTTSKFPCEESRAIAWVLALVLSPGSKVNRWSVSFFRTTRSPPSFRTSSILAWVRLLKWISSPSNGLREKSRCWTTLQPTGTSWWKKASRRFKPWCRGKRTERPGHFQGQSATIRPGPAATKAFRWQRLRPGTRSVPGFSVTRRFSPSAVRVCAVPSVVTLDQFEF
jgi:hypothetical protein